MTDAEKDREAMERFERHLMRESSLNPPWSFRARSDDADRILALAREALAMRERGPVAWAPSPRPGEVWTHEIVKDKDGLASWSDYGYRIIPLYAGEPEEVEE